MIFVHVVGTHLRCVTNFFFQLPTFWTKVTNFFDWVTNQLQRTSINLFDWITNQLHAKYHVMLCCNWLVTQSKKLVILVQKVGNWKKKLVTCCKCVPTTCTNIISHLYSDLPSEYLKKSHALLMISLHQSKEITNKYADKD